MSIEKIRSIGSGDVLNIGGSGTWGGSEELGIYYLAKGYRVGLCTGPERPHPRPH
jgi:hypothetical protein